MVVQAQLAWSSLLNTAAEAELPSLPKPSPPVEPILHRLALCRLHLNALAVVVVQVEQQLVLV